jgi:xylose isomerase
MFGLVKFLEDVGYDGPRHFDAHAYRTEDVEGVKDFARGCMRTYLILKNKAKRWNEDAEIRGIISEIDRNAVGHVGKFSGKNAESLLEKSFDRAALSRKGLQYERLDQLTMEVLLGVR